MKLNGFGSFIITLYGILGSKSKKLSDRLIQSKLLYTYTYLAKDLDKKVIVLPDKV